MNIIKNAISLLALIALIWTFCIMIMPNPFIWHLPLYIRIGSCLSMMVVELLIILKLFLEV